MVNLPPLVLGISAEWNKLFKSFLILILSFFSITGLAQEVEQSNLSGKELRKFNELFFQAQILKNKGDYVIAEEIFLELHKMDEQNATVNYELSDIYARGKDFDQAEEYAALALKKDPSNKWFYIQLAAIYKEQGLYSEEIRIYKDLKDQFPQEIDVYYDLADAYLRNLELEKAVDVLNDLETKVGILELVVQSKRQIYLRLGNFDAAVGEMKKLIEAYPNKLEYYGSLAQLYSANGYQDEAFLLYKQMLILAPEDPRPHLDLAKYFQEKGDQDSSLFHLKIALKDPNLELDTKISVIITLLEASERDTMLRAEVGAIIESLIVSDSTDSKVYLIYGDFLIASSKKIEARNAYKRAMLLSEEQSYKLWEQILLLDSELGLQDSVYIDAELALEYFPNQALPYFFLGLASSDKQEYDEGIIYLESGLKLCLGNLRLKEQFYIQLADINHRLENHEKSDEYFESALRLNNRNPNALNNYAYYLSLRKEKLERALELSAKSNSLSPSNPTFLDTWAWVYYQKEDYSNALIKIEAAINAGGKTNAEILEHYGDILMKLERKSEALAQWKKALELNSGSESLKKKIST